MARYNTSSTTNTINGTATISSPFQGAFTEFTGTAPYTVTLPAPGAFPGVNQTFYNSTGGVVTISTPSGSFTGTGGPNASTFAINSGNVVSVVPDGTNYIVISEDGSPMVATTGSFSGNLSVTGGATVLTPGSFSLNPGGTGSAIDNVNIGSTTRSSGAFTSLAANQAVTFTAGTSSSSTSTGTLVVTGGIGASGNIYSGATVSAINLTGTLTTAAQTAITSIGTLSSLAVSGTAAIGGSNSGYQLQVVGNIGTTGITISSGGGTNIANTVNIDTNGSGQARYYSHGSNASTVGGHEWHLASSNGAIDTIGLYLSTAGNLAIGITSPDSKLHIRENGADIVGGNAVKSNTMKGITIDNTNNDNSSVGVWFSTGPGSHWAGISGQRTSYSTTWGTDLRFYTHEDATVDLTYTRERVRITSGGNLGVGLTVPEGRLHVQQTAITAAAPSLGWPNYINPDLDANAKIVAIFDTAGNASVATAGYGPTVALRLGSYYDSRAVISPIGAGGASPSDQGTGRGKDLMVKGGQSDNGNGLVGGRLFLNGGAGFSGGAFGALGYNGDVNIQASGGNTFIGKPDAYGAAYNNLLLPFKYDNSGDWSPQKGTGWVHIGSFTHRAGNRYLDIKTNNNSGSLMFMFHIYGYLYNSANINTYIGGYSYTGSSILNNYVQNLGNATATTYRTSTNNYLCIRIDRGSNGYSEGKLNVFFHAWNAGEMTNMVVTSYAQNDGASVYYTS